MPQCREAFGGEHPPGFSNPGSPRKTGHEVLGPKGAQGLSLWNRGRRDRAEGLRRCRSFGRIDVSRVRAVSREFGVDRGRAQVVRAGVGKTGQGPSMSPRQEVLRLGSVGMVKGRQLPGRGLDAGVASTVRKAFVLSKAQRSPGRRWPVYADTVHAIAVPPSGRITPVADTRGRLRELVPGRDHFRPFQDHRAGKGASKLPLLQRPRSPDPGRNHTGAQMVMPCCAAYTKTTAGHAHGRSCAGDKSPGAAEHPRKKHPADRAPATEAIRRADPRSNSPASSNRTPVLSAPNRPFSGWDNVFPDPGMTVAAIDRLVHHATIFELHQVESDRGKEAARQLKVQRDNDKASRRRQLSQDTGHAGGRRPPGIESRPLAWVDVGFSGPAGRLVWVSFSLWVS